MKEATVFEFMVWDVYPDGVDYDHTQFRYVVAKSEKEAFRKMDKHNAERIAKGFLPLQYSSQPNVELDYVIV